MDVLRTNWKKVLPLIIILIGLMVIVVLVRKPQVFKSRADATKFQVTGRDGSEASYENGKFTTTSDHITIGIKDLSKF